MANPSSDSPGAFSTISIVGVGLIGGSIAAAAKQRSLAQRIIGVGRNLQRLQKAQKHGVIDACTVDLAQAAAGSDLMVFCTPVDKIAQGVKQAAPHCRPGTLLTDGGSIKGAICDEIGAALPEGVHFVGAHPIAGSEKQGFEHADADLFEDRICVVTPQEDCDARSLTRISEFWRRLGSTVVEMSPQTHDEILAETSHLPHLVASALAATLHDENRQFAAGGFSDTTRIAAGDEQLWTAIFQGNKPALLAALSRFEEQVGSLRAAVEAGDAERMRQLLRAARERREGM